MRKTIISASERSFWTHVSDPLGSLNDSYIGQILDNGLIDLLGVPTETMKIVKRWNRAE